MFAYCNNNPTDGCDPNGNCSYFLWWKIDCGKATCPESENYNPSAEKAAVLFDNRTSGYLGGLFGGKGFNRQGQAWVEELEKTYAVESIPFSDMGGFVDGWNSLEGEYQVVYIIMHGYPGGLSCSGKTLSNSTSGDYDFFDLKPASVSNLYLFSCNGATLSARNDSVASNLEYLTGGNVYAVRDGTVNYPLYGHIPYTEYGVWTVTKGYISWELQ